MPGKEKSFDYTYTLHHVLLHQVRAVGNRGSGGLSSTPPPPPPPQILAGIEAKPSPSKSLGLLKTVVFIAGKKNPAAQKFISSL